MDDWRFKIALPERMVTEPAEECAFPLAMAGIPLKRLQKSTGKASWTACLVPELKPFVDLAGRRWPRLRRGKRAEAARGEG
jgi:hypothetical protein